jgi:hypothetical protein
MWQDEILSPEARRIEEEFRLLRLQELVDTGQWEKDESGNVVPAGMSAGHKAEVAARAVSSIIELVPVLEAPEGATLNWHADASLLQGAIVVRFALPNVIEMEFDRSELHDVTYNL